MNPSRARRKTTIATVSIPSCTSDIVQRWVTGQTRITRHLGEETGSILMADSFPQDSDEGRNKKWHNSTALKRKLNLGCTIAIGYISDFCSRYLTTPRSRQGQPSQVRSCIKDTATAAFPIKHSLERLVTYFLHYMGLDKVPEGGL